MKLLLHTCCAPCLIYPLEVLRAKGIEVEGLFYNPNIQPFSEYTNRKKAVEDFTKDSGFRVMYPDYLPEEFFRAVNMMEDKLERCPICWYLRFKYTAQAARDCGFSHFSSTLLASPYQDQELLKKIGQDIADEEGIDFYYEDFRPGFKKAQAQAKAKGLYSQKYCGCIYSEMERYNKIKV